MKLFRRVLATVMAVALLAFVPGFNAATAKAEGAVTYSLKYVNSLSEWRVQKLAQWDDGRENGALSFLYNNLKDGDSVVVWGADDAAPLDNLKLDANVTNLTLYGVTKGVVVYANKNIKDIYVVKGSAASLHGTYENVHVFDNCSANINDNVKFVQVSKESSMEMNVTAVGTVDHCQIDDRGNVLTNMYNIKANSLRIVKGENKTDPSTYSTTPTGSPAAPATTTPSTPATTTNNGGAIAPQTGENSFAIVLLIGAAICVAGAVITRKKIA